MKRITIKDIAKAAKVSPTAVSFALNDKPGISADTRARILEVAATMGWTPNSFARALSISKTNSIGLVIPRPNTPHTGEHFYFNFMVGLQTELRKANYQLVLHLADDFADELETYRSWWGQRKVDGVVVVNPRRQDSRAELLRELNLPAVFVGENLPPASAVLANDGAMMESIVQHLAEQGCTSTAYICGDPARLHATRRINALKNYAYQHGTSIQIAANTDFTEYAGYIETTRLITGRIAPHALIFENEVLALGGLQALYDNDLTPGEDVLLVSCEDSPVCRVVKPAISAINRTPESLGVHAATVLVEVLAGQPPHTITEEIPQVIVRASSAKRITRH